MDFVLQTPKSYQNTESVTTDFNYINSNIKLPQIYINNSVDSAKTASQCKNVISHVLLQSDLPNLINLTNKLEQALKESKSHHIRKIQRVLQR